MEKPFTFSDPKLASQAKAEAIASVIFDALTPEQRFEIAWGDAAPSCDNKEVADIVQKRCYFYKFRE